MDPSDDWSGVTDPAERRRRQNRVHQRALRMIQPYLVQAVQ
jgi:hypothetical protein